MLTVRNRHERNFSIVHPVLLYFTYFIYRISNVSDFPFVLVLNTTPASGKQETEGITESHSASRTRFASQENRGEIVSIRLLTPRERCLGASRKKQARFCARQTIIPEPPHPRVTYLPSHPWLSSPPSPSPKAAILGRPGIASPVRPTKGAAKGGTGLH